MERMHGDTFSRLVPAALRQTIAKSIVAFVADPDPVDRTQHDRIFRPEKNHTTTSQTEFFDPLDAVISHHRADRRSGIDVERG